MTPSLRDELAGILTTVDPWEKAAKALATVAAVGPDGPQLPGTPPGDWPFPARREAPELRPPSQMPKRRLGSLEGRQALLHAIAHIELNAIDLAADMAGRFAHEVEEDARADFVRDWLSVMDDEARHFRLIADRLEALDTRYGALPAHDGLFEAAARTAHDWKARLAIAPLVLEARGLDVTPGMQQRFLSAGDPESAALLKIIYEDEIGHVAAGSKWFRHACARDGADPAATFQALVATYFPVGLKRPFNDDARGAAGLDRAWYEALADPPA